MRREGDEVALPTGWRCRDCQQDVDATRHDAHDPEVSELSWLIDDIRRAIEVLPSRRAAALKGSAVAKFLEDGDAAGDGGDGGDDYSKYKVSELREFLVRRGLDSDGLKQALVDRLREHDGTA